MEKVYVVYWSGTGNTESMANMLAAGVNEAGAQAEVVPAEDINIDTLVEQTGFALGCPSMGNEELEDSVMEPLVTALESKVSGKNLVLFGSYDWGDGEWMRTWVERMTNAGANIVSGEGVIANGEPDGDAEQALKAIGAELAKL